MILICEWIKNRQEKKEKGEKEKKKEREKNDNRQWNRVVCFVQFRT